MRRNLLLKKQIQLNNSAPIGVELRGVVLTTPHLLIKVIKIERSKFNVDKDSEKRTYNGIVFDSVLEMKYYRDVLCPLVESGDVVSFELQKPYQLQPKFIHNGKTVQEIKYVADFFIVYKDGREEVIDTKGCPDSTAILKRKMFWYLFPDINYQWVTYVKKFGGWIDYDECRRLRKEDRRKKAMEKDLKESS